MNQFGLAEGSAVQRHPIFLFLGLGGEGIQFIQVLDQVNQVMQMFRK